MTTQERLDDVIRFDVLDAVPGLMAGMTTRAFSPLQESRANARRRLADRLGFTRHASAEQVHATAVATVKSGENVRGYDGLVTQEPGLLLTVVAADCALLLLADPEAGVLGASHSGWRGTAGNIAEETIRRMVDLGAAPTRIRAAVGPCISVEAFEVGEEVANAFSPSFVERRDEWRRPHVNLKSALRHQLLSAGLQEKHLTVSAACTAADTERFYSYRAEKTTTGRLLGFIGWRR